MEGSVEVTFDVDLLVGPFDSNSVVSTVVPSEVSLDLVPSLTVVNDSDVGFLVEGRLVRGPESMPSTGDVASFSSPALANVESLSVDSGLVLVGFVGMTLPVDGLVEIVALADGLLVVTVVSFFGSVVPVIVVGFSVISLDESVDSLPFESVESETLRVV